VSILTAKSESAEVFCKSGAIYLKSDAPDPNEEIGKGWELRTRTNTAYEIVIKGPLIIREVERNDIKGSKVEYECVEVCEVAEGIVRQLRWYPQADVDNRYAGSMPDTPESVGRDCVNRIRADMYSTTHRDVVELARATPCKSVLL
jgi:hypothetical protein